MLNLPLATRIRRYVATLQIPVHVRHIAYDLHADPRTVALVCNLLSARGALRWVRPGIYGPVEGRP